MYRKILNPFFMTVILLLVSFNAQAAASKTVTLDVPGMTCKFCPITVRKALGKVPGVTEVKASYDTKTATATYDPDQTNVEALIKATTEAGYPSTLKK